MYHGSVEPKGLKKYTSKMEKIGVLVKTFSSKDMDCVLKAQLERLLAFTFSEVIKIHFLTKHI